MVLPGSWGRINVSSFSLGFTLEVARDRTLRKAKGSSLIFQASAWHLWGKSLQKPEDFQQFLSRKKCCVHHGTVVMEKCMKYEGAFPSSQARGQSLSGSTHSRVMQREQPRVPDAPKGLEVLRRLQHWNWLGFTSKAQAAECRFLMNRENCTPLQFLAQLSYWPSACSEDKPLNTSLEGQQAE